MTRTEAIPSFTQNNSIFWIRAFDSFLSELHSWLLSGHADLLQLSYRMRAGSIVALRSLQCPLVLVAILNDGVFAVQETVIKESIRGGEIPGWARQKPLPALAYAGLLKDVAEKQEALSFQRGDTDPMNKFGVSCAVAAPLKLHDLQQDELGIMAVCNRPADYEDACNPYPEHEGKRDSFGTYDERLLHAITKTMRLV